MYTAKYIHGWHSKVVQFIKINLRRLHLYELLAWTCSQYSILFFFRRTRQMHAAQESMLFHFCLILGRVNSCFWGSGSVKFEFFRKFYPNKLVSESILDFGKPSELSSKDRHVHLQTLPIHCWRNSFQKWIQFPEYTVSKTEHINMQEAKSMQWLNTS